MGSFTHYGGIERRICNDKEYVYCMWDGQISRWFELTIFFKGL